MILLEELEHRYRTDWRERPWIRLNTRHSSKNAHEPCGCRVWIRGGESLGTQSFVMNDHPKVYLSRAFQKVANGKFLELSNWESQYTPLNKQLQWANLVDWIAGFFDSKLLWEFWVLKILDFKLQWRNAILDVRWHHHRSVNNRSTIKMFCHPSK